MRLVPSQPVTIERVRYAERWFPFLFRHTDGSLLLYIEYGHDGHFSPAFRMRSTDGGRTWGERVDNVPRQCWSHSFPDGELFEIDTYGVHDPKTEADAVFFGAWSTPGVCGSPVDKGLVRVHVPSLRKQPLREFMSAGSFPTFHWWPLWNGLHTDGEPSGDDINIIGSCFTTGIELDDGRLLALMYGKHKDTSIEKSCVFCLESKDRGSNWDEIALVAKDDSTPEGPDEATMVQLDDGRLYSVMRTGDQIMHTWSADLGLTWLPPAPVELIDSDDRVRSVWPWVKKLEDGTLVLVYGRPKKHMVFDPSGTGTQWQGHLDLHAHELETQAMMGVPEELRLRGDPSPEACVRYWDSSDYISFVVTGPREMLVVYDVQSYIESWNAEPVSAVRMVRVTLEN